MLQPLLLFRLLDNILDLGQESGRVVMIGVQPQGLPEVRFGIEVLVRLEILHRALVMPVRCLQADRLKCLSKCLVGYDQV